MENLPEGDVQVVLIMPVGEGEIDSVPEPGPGELAENLTGLIPVLNLGNLSIPDASVNSVVRRWKGTN